MTGLGKRIAPLPPCKGGAILATFVQRGVGMLELLIALLVFSTGMMGLLSAQLAGKKAGYEAAQRSVATVLARDILERMRANARQLDAYSSADVGDEGHRFLQPEANCNTVTCSAQELAAFDLWEWETLLLGDSQSNSGSSAGGLVSPRACISNDDGTVAVTISWLASAVSPQEENAATCMAEPSGVEDAPPDAEAGNWQRQQLSVSTFIGTR